MEIFDEEPFKSVRLTSDGLSKSLSLFSLGGSVVRYSVVEVFFFLSADVVFTADDFDFVAELVENAIFEFVRLIKFDFLI